MALINMLGAIGDAIRIKSGKKDLIPLERMPAAIEDLPTVQVLLQEKTVTENGTVKPDFWCSGLSAVHVAVNNEASYNEGRKAEYDKFWDNFQDNGDRTNYSYGFGTRGWTDDNFKPKYDIVPDGNATSLFRYLEVTEDLPAIFERQGIVLDTSQATNLEYFFTDSSLLSPIGLGTVDCTGLTTRLTSSFSSRRAKQVRLIIHDSVVFYNSFNAATNLTDLELEGTLGTNGLNLQNSPLLTHDSLMSVIHALKDYSGSGTAYTVALGGENLAKLTTEEKQLATNKGWTLA